MSGNLMFIGGLGPGEIVIILVVVLILFGGRKIPQLARDLGKGIREFRKSISGNTDDLSEQIGFEDETTDNKYAQKKGKRPSRKKSKR